MRDEGLLWVDDSAGTTWTLKTYDGNDWITLFTIDTTANTAAAPLADSSITTAKIADGAVTSAKLAAGAAAIVGEVKSYIGTTVPTGWLFLNGDTIGSAASTATQKSDSFQTLFELLWNSMVDTQTPVIGGRGVSANADWVADKAITLLDSRGRSVIGTGTGAGLTARTHGATGGAEDAIVVTHTHADTFSIASVGGHTHTVPEASSSGTFVGFLNGGDTLVTNRNSGSAGGHGHTLNGAVSSTGSSSTDQNMHPFLALNYIIKF